MTRIPMMQKLGLTTRLFAVVLCAIFPSAVARAQKALTSTMKDQLQAQYKLAKTGSDSGGLKILEPGTVFVIQKGGILGTPPVGNGMHAVYVGATFKDGELHSPGGFSRALMGNNTRLFQIGEKVYALKLDVDVKNDRVSLILIECDSCNVTNQPSSYEALIFVQFPKGYLESADVDQVQAVIGQVLAVDTGTGGAPQQGQEAQGQPAAQPQDAPAQPPPTIQMGQTTDQVQAILGPPDKMVDLGPKQIYVYKDLKVTFVNGKVSDVQ